MEEELLESLTCSVCLELPESEIYQCINGHTICKNCCAPLNECPECRVPYVQAKCRNRALERILEDIKVECKFKSDGCLVIDKRSIVLQHEKICHYRPITLCEVLGYECNASCNNPRAIVTHLKDHHKLRSICSPVKLKIVGAVHGDLKTNLGILTHGKDAILLTMITMLGGKTCSFQPIHITMDEKQSTNISIGFRIWTKNGRDKMTWSITPSHFKQAKEALLEPQLQLTTAWLEKNCVSQERWCNLEITVSSKENQNSLLLNASHDRTQVQLNPFERLTIGNQTPYSLKDKPRMNSTPATVLSRTPTRGSEIWLLARNGECYNDSVIAWQSQGKTAYIIRAFHNGCRIPGVLQMENEAAKISFRGHVYSKNEYEVLLMPPGAYIWKKCTTRSFHDDAIPGGNDSTGLINHIGRVVYGSEYAIGTITANNNNFSCFAACGGSEQEYEDCEVLCYTPTISLDH